MQVEIQEILQSAWLDLPFLSWNFLPAGRFQRVPVILGSLWGWVMITLSQGWAYLEKCSVRLIPLRLKTWNMPILLRSEVLEEFEGECISFSSKGVHVVESLPIMNSPQITNAYRSKKKAVPNLVDPTYRKPPVAQAVISPLKGKKAEKKEQISRLPASLKAKLAQEVSLATQ